MPIIEDVAASVLFLVCFFFFLILYRYYCQKRQSLIIRQRTDMISALGEHAMVFICNRSLVITHANKLLQNLLDDPIGTPFTRYFREPWFLETLDKIFSSGQSWRGELKVKDSWVELSLVPHRGTNEEIIGLIGIGTDITNLKLALDAKTRFLANMSHEIRTPLNGILGNAELLLMTKLSTEQKDFAETISNSSVALLTVINDILEISRIESGKTFLVDQVFDVEKLLSRVIKLFKPLADKKGVELSLEVSSNNIVVADEHRLSQVINNLVGNAIKFTARGGKVKVYANTELQSLEVKVCDTGIGIAKEKLEEIFLPFTQEESSTSRRFGGTGLGLTIARELVRLMGGELKVRSEKGKGTEFWFKLPVGEALEEPIIIGDEIRESKSLKVLIAEDNLVNKRLIANLLDKFGHTPIVVSSGLEAVESMNSGVDLVLMDIQMPEMDGYQASSEIRKQFPEIPIVAMTAHAMAEDKKKCLDVGMNDFLAKPFKADEVRAILSKYQPRNTPKNIGTE